MLRDTQTQFNIDVVGGDDKMTKKNCPKMCNENKNI